MRASSVVLVTLLGLSGLLGLTACDFFRELQSLPDAGEDESGSGDGSGDTEGETEGDSDAGPCTVYDNYCGGQDEWHVCNPETEELEEYSCSNWCGGNSLLNFACVPDETVVGFIHGCWCVEPGAIKLDTCVQLEDCIVGCGSDPNDDCTPECFARTDAATTRVLGQLYSCADLACDAECTDNPTNCAACLAYARKGLYGDCGLARKVCDDDETDEPSWP